MKNCSLPVNRQTRFHGLFVCRLGLALGFLLGGGCVSIYNSQPVDPSRSSPPAASLDSPRLLPDPVVQFGTKAGGRHYYQAVAAPDGITWAGAQAWALAHGGYLATIHSAAENEFVFHLVDAPRFWVHDATESLGPWLGGYRANDLTEAVGDWRWLHQGDPFTYQHWAPDQPNNSNGNESRMQFWAMRTTADRLSTWNDIRADFNLQGFIVEYDGRPKAG